jgi:hypothetical protein
MIADELRHQGWLILNNIKKTDPQRVDVPALMGEIDIVTGKAGQPTPNPVPAAFVTNPYPFTPLPELSACCARRASRG